MTAEHTVDRTDDAMGVVQANLMRMSGRVVVRGAISALCVATGILFLLAAATFQPSWANGWSGVSKHVVFATFSTALLGMAMIALITGALFVVCYCAEAACGKSYVGWVSFFFLLMLACVAVLGVCPHVYRAVHASIVTEWQ